MIYHILATISLENTDLTVIDKLVESLVAGSILLVQRIAIAIVVFIIGSWLIKWIRKISARFLTSRKIDSTVSVFLDSVINISLKVLLLLTIVHIIGISTTSFTAILAAAGLAVGMAMKDNLSNFAGGVMLLVNKPFKIGDRILSQSIDGEVQSIGILYTTLLTSDNRTVYLPNGPLSTGTISNYSRQSTRRIDKRIKLRHGVDIEQVKKELLELLKQEERILNSPSPSIGVVAIGNATIEISIKIWVKHFDFSNVDIQLNEMIYTKFLEDGIYK